MCYVIQNTARGRGGADGQKEDEGQGDEEGRPEEDHQGCWCQAQDGRSGEEAALAGSEGIPSGARGPRGRRIDGSPGPAPRLVAVPLLETLIAKARPARAKTVLRESLPRLRLVWGFIHLTPSE